MRAQEIIDTLSLNVDGTVIQFDNKYLHAPFEQIMVLMNYGYTVASCNTNIYFK